MPSLEIRLCRPISPLALADEPRALATFNSLTPALRRQIIRYVDQAKHASTREKRIRLLAKRMLERAAKRKKKKNSGKEK